MADPWRLRRRVLLRGACGGVGAALVGCTADGSGSDDKQREGGTDVTTGGDDDRSQGRLLHRPVPPAGQGTGRTGRFEVDTGGSRPAAVHVPEARGPLRLVVVLHGAGGEPHGTRELLSPYAEKHRLLLVAPASQGQTWDVIQGGFGPDVAAIDELVRQLTTDHPVAGCTVAGFSDGASYALTLGIANGDVFDSVMAFSPGFEAAEVRHGSPRFFVSHGMGDKVLPIDRCSRRLVPLLEESGYDVTYKEFDGGHEVPGVIRDRAVDWLT